MIDDQYARFKVKLLQYLKDTNTSTYIINLIEKFAIEFEEEEIKKFEQYVKDNNIDTGKAPSA